VDKATLLVVRGVDQGSRFEIRDVPQSLGRGARNEIRILDTEVSRLHAEILEENGAYVLLDKGSSNGTFVNGKQIRRQMLENGDQIQIGRSVILFSQQGEDESQFVAERIDLQHQHPEDQSSIIGEMSHDGDSLLKESPTIGEKNLARSLADLKTLYRISEETVSPTISQDQLLKRILELTIDAVGADRGCILLNDPATGQKLVPRALCFRHDTDDAGKMPVSRTIVDYVLRRGQGVRTSDARRDRRFERGESIVQAGIREAMCVPMQGRFDMIGVVYVDITTPSEQLLTGSNTEHFTEDQLRLLVAVGRQSAMAVENQHYQQALLKAERLGAMGQTIAMLSHHIKNILQGVRGGSYLIDMGLKDHKEDVVRRGWTIVEKNQNRIYHLVMDMLTFSKERQPDLQMSDLNATVGDVCELMQARADETNSHLEVGLAPDLPKIMFDAEGMHRAVLNIVINALDAVEGSPNAAVRVQTGFDPVGDNALVVITDNGPGIAQEQITKIFNVFESSKGARGTGLGLAVSQKILREHGGEITVESKLGEGCQFVLAWPRMDEEHRSDDSGTQA
jgi:signal transduction histidine kinase/pSer/pThr/pTyr-binding forkhead associated (FHA) protein